MAVSLRFRVSVLLAAFVTASAVGAAAPAPVPAPPDLDVGSYVLADYDTGQILAEQNPHRELYPASTLKVLTADTLIPHLDPALKVTPQAADFAAEPDGSVVGMTAGVTYRVADLWRATFIESANDAVAELAHLSGGLGATIAAMQKEARSLGALDTTVADADGYDQDGQLTSAYDLALFARAGLHIPAFRGYCDLKQTTFPAPHGATLTLTSHDPMVKSYPGMIGIKGGLTTKAGHTYIGAATRDGHTLIETLMLGGTDVFDQAARLMDWGFQADGKVAPVGTLSAATVPTGSGSGQKSTVAVTSPPAPPAKTTLTPPGTPTSPTSTRTSPKRIAAGPDQAPSSPGEAPSSPVARVDAASRPQPPAQPWPGAAWLGAMAALAAVAIPVGAQGLNRRRKP